MEVREALTEAGVIGVTVIEVKGCGWQKGHSDIYRGAEYVVELLSKVKLGLVVGDALCQVAVDAILKAAHTGKIGDGKVFVQDLESIIRIRTGGSTAWGRASTAACSWPSASIC